MSQQLMTFQNGAKQTMNVMPAPTKMNHNFRPGQNEAKGGAFEPVNMSSHVVSTFASNVAGAEDILDDEEGGNDGEVIDTVTDRLAHISALRTIQLIAQQQINLF